MFRSSTAQSIWKQLFFPTQIWFPPAFVSGATGSYNYGVCYWCLITHRGTLNPACPLFVHQACISYSLALSLHFEVQMVKLSLVILSLAFSVLVKLWGGIFTVVSSKEFNLRTLFLYLFFLIRCCLVLFVFTVKHTVYCMSCFYSRPTQPNSSTGISLESIKILYYSYIVTILQYIVTY